MEIIYASQNCFYVLSHPLSLSLCLFFLSFFSFLLYKASNACTNYSAFLFMSATDAVKK